MPRPDEANGTRRPSIRSSSLQTLTTLAHPLAVAGDYAATVIRDGDEIATFDVVVAPDCTAYQVNLDLAQVEEHRTGVVHVRPGGHLVFFVTHGESGYSVRIRRLGDDDLTSAYDTRSLQPRDLFVAMPPRPGRYQLFDRGGRRSVRIDVASQGAAAGGHAPPPPAQIRLTGEGFDRDALRLEPSQGLTVTVEAPHTSLEILGPE